MPMERMTRITVEEFDCSPGSTSPCKSLVKTTTEIYGLTAADQNSVSNKLLDVAKALNDADTAAVNASGVGGVTNPQ